MTIPEPDGLLVQTGIADDGGRDVGIIGFDDPEFHTSPEDGQHAAMELFVYANQLAVERKANPRNDLVSVLIQVQMCANTGVSFRQLGMGYANLGALLMSRGLAYDSDEGRAYAAAITALMTGRAYRKSAEIAKRVAPPVKPGTQDLLKSFLPGF